jgi:hypothetical protein
MAAASKCDRSIGVFAESLPNPRVGESQSEGNETYDQNECRVAKLLDRSI